MSPSMIHFARLCLWPFALYAAFPHALDGRYSTDYYGQSVPSVPVASQERLPSVREGQAVPR
jgi:hypothetical protein